jgi:hypothetical protein
LKRREKVIESQIDCRFIPGTVVKHEFLERPA